MTNINWKSFLRWGFVLLSFVFIAIFSREMFDPEILSQLSFKGLVIPLMLYTLSVSLNSSGWVISLKLWNIPKTHISMLLKSTGLILFGKYLPGKIFGLAARIAVYKTKDLSAKFLLSVTFLEQLAILQASVFLCVILWFLMLPSGLISFLGVIFGFLGLLINLSGISRIILNGLKIFISLDYFYALSYPRRGYAPLTLVFASSILVNGLALCSVAWNFDHVGVSCFYILLCGVTSLLLGFLAPIAPAGLGVRDLGLVGLLSIDMVPADAAYLALVFRLLTLLCDLVIGVVLMFIGVMAERWIRC